MSELLKILHEQLLDYSTQLKVVEAEIIRKYKAREDCEADVKKAVGLKLLKEECAKMMAEQKFNL